MLYRARHCFAVKGIDADGGGLIGEDEGVASELVLGGLNGFDARCIAEGEGLDGVERILEGCLGGLDRHLVVFHPDVRERRQGNGLRRVVTEGDDERGLVGSVGEEGEKEEKKKKDVLHMFRF